RAMLGRGVVDVRVDAPTGGAATAGRNHHGRSPHDLFAEFLQAQHVTDERVPALFADLLDESLQGPGACARPPRRSAAGARGVRPIRLEMEGFGAFRAATVVDFSDIELVALVGRTG